MAARRATSSGNYERALIEAQGLRVYVLTARRPLFDDLLKLAAHNQQRGNRAVALRDLKHAKSLANPPTDYAPPKHTSKRARVSDSARAVLAIAEQDYQDDRDGAEFHTPKEKTSAKRLAEQGYLRVLSADRKFVRAVLTDKGALLLADLRGESSAGPVRYVVQLIRRSRGNQADVLVNGSVKGSGSYYPDSGELVGAFRGVVRDLREKHPAAEIILPGGLVDANELITEQRMQSLIQ